MSSVRVRPETDKLYIDFRYLGIRCREQFNLINNTKNIKKLNRLAKNIDAEITLDQFDYSKTFPNSKLLAKVNEKILERPEAVPNFDVFAVKWLEQKQPEWKLSYIKSIQSILDTHLLPIFCKKNLSQIKKPDLLEFRSTLSKLPGKDVGTVLSPTRINHIMSPLIMILNDASSQYDFPSPTRGIKLLRIARTKVEPFTLQEVKFIIDSVRKDFRFYYTVRFFTGMRTSEIDGLKWQYVDFDKRQILICESLVSGHTVSTKNDTSFRSIDMTQTVYEAMKSQYEHTGDGDYVFCTRKGTPLNHNNVTNRIWHPLLRELGLTARRPYVTRHTAATLWLASGENAEWIAKQLGHSTTELLHKVYSRYVPNLTRRDGTAFEKLLLQTYHNNTNTNNAVANIHE